MNRIAPFALSPFDYLPVRQTGAQGDMSLYITRQLKVLFVFVFVAYSHLLFSQTDSIAIPPPVDSSYTANGDSLLNQHPKRKHPSTLNDTWFISSEPERHYVIDTSIFHIEDYNVVERNGIEYENVGNTGTAAYPLVFSMDKSTGFNTGYNQFDIYRYYKDSIRYYQVIRPYAELGMMIGLKHEQIFDGTFANQHKGIIYYGVTFRVISSNGIYQNQTVKSGMVDAYAIYNSKNQHWTERADVIFNSFKVEENGGVTANPFTGDYFEKNLVPVALDNQLSGNYALNYYRQIEAFLTSTYSIGKKYWAPTRHDSVWQQKLLPVFMVSHQFTFDKNSFRFRDYFPDSTYYGEFFTPDSAYNDLQYLDFGNAFTLEYHPRSVTSDTSYSEKDFIAYAETGFDYYHLTQNGDINNFGNWYVGGAFRSNYASKLKLIYQAAARYYLYGYNRDDLLVDGFAGYDYGALGVLTGNAAYQLKQAPYIFERYVYETTSWNYNLPKTKILNIGGKYQQTKYGVTVDVNYYVADHLPVYPGQADPYVTTNEENVFVIHAGNRNSVAHLHFDDDVWYTYPATSGYISNVYPRLYLKSSIYYELRLFKKAMWMAFGVDVRYRYQNNAPYYDPYFGQFYPTYVTTTTYPVVDAFVNLKIKTVRVFLKVDNLSSLIGGTGYYAAYLYPAADFSFQAGVRWRFFE